MTPLMLQDDLIAEVKKITEGMAFPSPKGGTTQINVYSQSLPVQESDEEDDPIPYIIVRLDSGEDFGEGDSTNKVKVVIIVGMWDAATDSQGYRHMMNIFQKIYYRFHTKPSLNDKYAYVGPFKWATQEDGYYPYYFGACELNFAIPAIRKEDPLA